MNKQKVNILVVDDIKLNYVILKGMLQSDSTRILWARDHKEALEFCDNYSLDLVLMDFQLPEVNGLELSKKLKNKHKHIPIIFQTANAHTVESFDKNEFNYKTVLQKPIQRDLLVNTLKQYIAL